MFKNLKKPYLIAEISGNHNGSLERAKELISSAKINGADCVKIQTYSPDTMTIKSKKKEGGNWKIQKRCALGATDKDVVINISGRRQSSSIYNISKIHTSLFPDSKNISSETVKMEKLDNYLEELSSLKKKILLKIDTQGYELEVIKGAEKIMPYIDCLLLEVSLTRLYEEQPLFEEILDYTSKNGFSIWSVDRVVGNKFTGQTHQLDVVFIK